MTGVMEVAPCLPVTQTPTSSFVRAYEKQNLCMESAITSLDNLSTQILQFVFTPPSPPASAAADAASPAQAEVADERELTRADRDKLKASMTLMRSLLVQAQTKFRKMVEDNRKLASRIDSSIEAANQEVSVLRAELTDTSYKLNQMMPLDVAAQTALSDPETRQLHELAILREENSRLRGEIRLLQQELADTRGHNGIMATDENKASSYKLDLLQNQQELNRAREALTAMKADRKRLKAEKLELLSQMKQLYCTLEDKEAELREFIRNYEMRMRESDEALKLLAEEKDIRERERWELSRQVEDATQLAAQLQIQLAERDQVVSALQTKLSEANEKLKPQGVGTIKSTTSSSSADSMLKPASPPSLDDTVYHDVTIPSDVTTSDAMTSKDVISPDPPSSARSMKSSASILSGSSGYHGSFENIRGSSVNRDSLVNLRPPTLREHSLRQQTGTEGEYVIISDVKLTRNKKRSKSPGAFTRIFGKSRTRRSVALTDHQALEATQGDLVSNRLSVLSQDNYQEKLSVLEQCRTTSMRTWKAGHVLAWLEIEMNMPLYGKVCAENIKSGKILLGLSDSELESALDLKSPLHRRKLRLAIEEHRDPSTIKFQKAGCLDHTWVAHRWISDLGLAQYRSSFESHLVDGRLLNVLTRKDLERHLGINRKFHQISIMHGIELLRRVSFNKEILNERRGQCENEDTDPLVWTNQRLLKWLQEIDLHEYSMALNESGLHGAVLVLEPSFNSDAFANLLGIAPSKSYVRRHLATEYETLVRPARAALDTPLSSSKKRASGSLGRESGRALQRSFKATGPETEAPAKRLSFRGSFSRALGKKVKESMEQDSKSTASSGDQSPANSTIKNSKASPPKLTSV